MQRYHHNDFGADGDCAAMEVVVMVIASQQWPRHQMVTARVVSYPLLPHTYSCYLTMGLCKNTGKYFPL